MRVAQPPSSATHLSPLEPKTLSPPMSGTRCSADSSHAPAHHHTASASPVPLASPRSACPYRPLHLSRGPQTWNTQNRTAERAILSACPSSQSACLPRRARPPGGFSGISTLAKLAKVLLPWHAYLELLVFYVRYLKLLLQLKGRLLRQSEPILKGQSARLGKVMQVLDLGPGFGLYRCHLHWFMRLCGFRKTLHALRIRFERYS